MQMPDLIYRQRQDGNISQNIWNCVTDEARFQVDAITRDCRIPGFGDRVALENADEDDSDCPRDGKGSKDPAADAHAADRKYAYVHEEEGYFSDADCGYIDAFMG